MKNCKVKMEIIDKEGNVIGTTIIECETIKTLKEYHFISALDEAYNQLLLGINKPQSSQSNVVIGSDRAVDVAIKMMEIPMEDLPELASEFLEYLSKKVGFCGETCITAYAAYNQMVLKMECNNELYKLTQPDLLEWWADKGYCL